jgi:hypothetical protein
VVTHELKIRLQAMMKKREPLQGNDG